MASIHSVCEELQFPTSLSLFTELGSTQQLSTSTDQVSVKSLDNNSITAAFPPVVVSVPSIKQEASGSPGCGAMPSQASDYHQVDVVTVSKEQEQEQFSVPAMDTLSISDIIAAMEEDTAPSTIGQATNTTYLPNHANPETKICDTFASPPTFKTQLQSTAIGYAHPQPQEFTSGPVTSSSTQPLSTTREYSYKGGTSTSPPQSAMDSGNGSSFSSQPLSTGTGYIYEGNTSTSPPPLAANLGNGCFTQPLSTARGYIYEENTSTSPLQSAVDSGNGSLDIPFSEDFSGDLSFGEWPSPQYMANSVSSGYASESVASESERCRHDSCVLHETSSCYSHAIATASSSMENRPHTVTDTENRKMATDEYQDSAQQSTQFDYLHVPTFTSTDSYWQTSAREPTPEFVFDFDQAMDFDPATTDHQFQYVNCIVDHIKDIQFDISPQTASV